MNQWRGARRELLRRLLIAASVAGLGGIATREAAAAKHQHHHKNYHKRYRKYCRKQCKQNRKTCNQACEILSDPDFCKQGCSIGESQCKTNC